MSQPHERLSEAMRRRGLQLGKRWVHIAKEAGITTSALGAIRRGEYRPSPHTAAALDDVLAWETGSVERILDGGEPTVREQRVPLGTAHETGEAGAGVVPTDEELRASGLKPETVEALLQMRRRVERWVETRDNDAIRRANRVTEALDEGQEAG
jgi:transcriptional regulator with XRE-family HTH domain